MKFIVSSTGDTFINAEQVKKFFVYQAGESSLFGIYADKELLSIHKSFGYANACLKEMINALSNSGGQMIYQMEDTI